MATWQVLLAAVGCGIVAYAHWRWIIPYQRWIRHPLDKGRRSFREAPLTTLEWISRVAGTVIWGLLPGVLLLAALAAGLHAGARAIVHLLH